jgi:thiol-disulfide isomerase/thioredoxin
MRPGAARKFSRLRSLPIRLTATLAAALMLLAAQQPPILLAAQQARAGPNGSPQEQADLEAALSDAGGNPAEYLRAIEKHLAKYPDTPRRPELERAAARAAMEANDDAGIVRYGERVLARQPDDPAFLDRVIRALLASDSREQAARALRYAQHYEQVAVNRRDGAAPRGSEGRKESDRAVGAALRYQARATGNLGKPEAALALARRSFDTWPDAESAREKARWLERLGRAEKAAEALADAFTIPDPSTTDDARARDRARLGELYAKAKGSEAGLGDMVLRAYDRNTSLLRTRALRWRAGDPNARLTDPMEFTLGEVGGAKLSLASLKGKVVVLDFWATWCAPCRAQHPLYEQVERRFRGNPSVVFLSVNSDEDRALVKPFLQQMKWGGLVYFEDGLARAWNIDALPTTIVVDGSGRVSSRITGAEPERFVEMLNSRISAVLRK